MKYTGLRFTKDLDVWVEASPVNSKKVCEALRTFGAPLEGLTEVHFADTGFCQMGCPPVRVDILKEIEGGRLRVRFEE